MPLPLACTVRACGLPLEPRLRAFVCARGHSYDVARSGYVNLLQPQDRRSLAAGDSRESIEARAALLAAGIGRTVLDAFVQMAASIQLSEGAPVVDLGSGSGETLPALGQQRAISGIGIDLSTAAADHAARRFPSCAWVVANADRRLPLLDGRVSLVLSLHGRRNPAECARVLAPGEHLLVAVPAPDDLIELRTAIQGDQLERERSTSVIAEHGLLFKLVARSSASEHHSLDRESLMLLLRATYRGERKSQNAHVAALTSLAITLSSEFLMFARQ